MFIHHIYLRFHCNAISIAYFPGKVNQNGRIFLSRCAHKKALPKQSFLTLVRLCLGVLILLDDRKDQTQQRQHDRRDDIQGNSQRVD